MASRVPLTTARQVKPLLSLDRNEARRRVINLYKAWYREIPVTVFRLQTNISVVEARKKLRELFEKNRNVTDIRTIDMLVIKGQMELMETAKLWKQPCHFLAYFKETVEPKPADFLSKFIAGQP